MSISDSIQVGFYVLKPIIVCLSIYYTGIGLVSQDRILESIQVGFDVLKPIVVCLSIYYTVIRITDQD